MRPVRTPSNSSPPKCWARAASRRSRLCCQPEIPLYAVGGANPENFAEYFAAGCTGFGIGSYLYKPGYTINEVAKRAFAVVAAYDRAKER